MCGFYIAIQWRPTIFGPHIDNGGRVVYVWFLYCHSMKADYIWSTHWQWRVCSLSVVYILPFNEGQLHNVYLVHTLMMEGAVYVHMYTFCMSPQFIRLSFMVYWFYFLKKYCTQMLCRGQVRHRSVYIFLKLIRLSVQNVATYTNFKYCKLRYTAGHYFFKGWSYSMCLDHKCTKCQPVCSRNEEFVLYLLFAKNGW